MQTEQPENLSQKPRRTRRFWFWLAVAVFGIGGAVLIAIPNFIKARETSCKNTCIANLKQIDGAKEQWALEFHKTTNDIPTFADLIGTTNYIKNTPTCPGGGHYILNAIGQAPACADNKADPSHALPE
jgi:hypothetical protein